MNETNKVALVIAFAIAAVLLLLFGGGAMMGVTLSGGMMGNGAMGGISWMWIPILFMFGICAQKWPHHSEQPAKWISCLFGA